MSKEKEVSWTRRTVVVTVVASVAGFWLPDGLRLLGKLFGKEPADANGWEKVAAALICVAFVLIIEQAHMTHQLLTQQRDAMVQSFRSNVEAHLSEGIRDVLAMAEIIAPNSNVRSEAVRLLLLNLSNLLHPVAGLPEPLRTGVATWMRTPLDGYRTQLRDLMTRGVSASLYEHVAVTRAIFETGILKYTQINKYAYDVELEWTREWRDFLAASKQLPGAIDYIVFASEDYLAENAQKLAAMAAYIKECDGRLLTCNAARLRDSVGTTEISDNLELFDELVIKTQSPIPGGYRGGITLTMSLAAAHERPDLVQLVRAIRESARPYE